MDRNKESRGTSRGPGASAPGFRRRRNSAHLAKNEFAHQISENGIALSDIDPQPQMVFEQSRFPVRSVRPYCSISSAEPRRRLRQFRFDQPRPNRVLAAVNPTTRKNARSYKVGLSIDRTRGRATIAAAIDFSKVQNRAEDKPNNLIIKIHSAYAVWPARIGLYILPCSKALKTVISVKLKTLSIEHRDCWA